MPTFAHSIPLAERTTLGVGGPARALASCASENDVREALEWADARGLPTFVLGGGSNLLVADAGFDGLVIELTNADYQAHEDGSRESEVRLSVGAGFDWDALVGLAVERGWAGLECLSGIPGRVGAAPIQNIGAYGQEVAETLRAVRAVDRQSGELRRIPAEDCRFGYRSSRFKEDWRDRFVITGVELALRPGGEPTVRYPELGRRLEAAIGGSSPSLADVRRTVLEIRRSKSMVLDPSSSQDPNSPPDPNRRSAGSFFTNPLVTRAQADEVAERARAQGIVRELPRYPSGETSGTATEKLSAAWLIEEAGFPRGYTSAHAEGRAGLSSRHTLALVNRGEARAADLVALAREIRHRVRERFGVTLVPEPVFLGFEKSIDELLG